MKTEGQIKEQIAELEEIKPHIIPKSFWGDDNVAQIDAAIWVLKNQNSITEDSIYDRFPDEVGEHELNGALHAYQWLNDQDPDAPAIGYAGIDQRNKDTNRGLH